MAENTRLNNRKHPRETTTGAQFCKDIQTGLQRAYESKRPKDVIVSFINQEYDGRNKHGEEMNWKTSSDELEKLFTDNYNYKTRRLLLPSERHDATSDEAIRNGVATTAFRKELNHIWYNHNHADTLIIFIYRGHGDVDDTTKHLLLSSGDYNDPAVAHTGTTSASTTGTRSLTVVGEEPAEEPIRPRAPHDQRVRTTVDFVECFQTSLKRKNIESNVVVILDCCCGLSGVRATADTKFSLIAAGGGTEGVKSGPHGLTRNLITIFRKAADPQNPIYFSLSQLASTLNDHTHQKKLFTFPIASIYTDSEGTRGTVKFCPVGAAVEAPEGTGVTMTHDKRGYEQNISDTQNRQRGVSFEMHAHLEGEYTEESGKQIARCFETLPRPLKKVRISITDHGLGRISHIQRGFSHFVTVRIDLCLWYEMPYNPAYELGPMLPDLRFDSSPVEVYKPSTPLRVLVERTARVVSGGVLGLSERAADFGQALNRIQQSPGDKSVTGIYREVREERASRENEPFDSPSRGRGRRGGL